MEMSSIPYLILILAVSTYATKDMSAYYKRVGEKYLAEIEKKENIIKLKSGLLVEILHESELENPKSPKLGDSCDVTYTGTFKDGKVFDSGRTNFAPNQVIQAWTEIMQYMVEGDKFKIYSPYKLAYGERGSPPKIPPYSTLVFEIEIHKVKVNGKPKTKETAKKRFKEAIVVKGTEDL